MLTTELLSETGTPVLPTTKMNCTARLPIVDELRTESSNYDEYRLKQVKQIVDEYRELLTA